MKEILLRRYEKIYRRLHRSNGHKHFLTECSKNRKFPNFTWIQPQMAKQLNLNPTQIKDYRADQLNRSLEDQLEKNENLKNDLNHIISVLSTLIHHNNLSTTIENIKQKIYYLEKSNDARRKRKLDLLITNPNSIENVQSAEINVINFTKNNKIIPLKIKKIISLGKKSNRR